MGKPLALLWVFELLQRHNRRLVLWRSTTVAHHKSGHTASTRQRGIQEQVAVENAKCAGKLVTRTSTQSPRPQLPQDDAPTRTVWDVRNKKKREQSQASASSIISSHDLNCRALSFSFWRCVQIIHTTPAMKAVKQMIPPSVPTRVQRTHSGRNGSCDSSGSSSFVWVVPHVKRNSQPGSAKCKCLRPLCVGQHEQGIPKWFGTE